MAKPNLQDVAAQLLDLAKSAGADAADVVVAAGESLSAETRDGRLEHAERAEGVDAGLRVLIGKRQACVSASDLRAPTLRALAERAVAMAKAAPEDPWCGLADPEQLCPADLRDAAALELDDPDGPPSPAALEAASLAAEAAAAAVEGVSRMDGAGASWSRNELFLAATNGFSGGYARAHATTYASAIAGEGLEMERDHAAETRRAFAALPDPEGIGTRAGRRAVARMSPRRAPTGAVPVLFDQRVSTSLLHHLVGAANGAAVARGASWLSEKLGEAVLPAGFTLIEEPDRVRGPSSRPFDAEGLRAARREIVTDGVLNGWTLDLASARKLGMQSTGNAGRGMASPPSPATTNLRLAAPVAAARDAMAARMGRGLIVTSLMGASINGTTGDYSRGASGFWVEDGAVVYPVNELTIAGNLHRMLAALEAADDPNPELGVIAPSLLVAEGLTVAGV
ncbi:TldD/PmbA family protein [Rhodovulum sp. DZ06]|uniref:TldD/PmbA family protein n=1 Tax=Rhodovulum sp. DZ06 TaxID=3425126 RepID=UPI003D352E72